MKNRFANFINLTKLTTIFKNVADIQTSDMLNLPIPKDETKIISSERTDFVASLMDNFAECAMGIRRS